MLTENCSDKVTGDQIIVQAIFIQYEPVFFNDFTDNIVLFF